VVFHQATVAALYGLGLMPPGFEPWSMTPVAPFGVPAVLSKAFWGGLWAILLFQFLNRTSGGAYWVGWTVLGAAALPLVAIFVVPPLKGMPIPKFPDRYPLYALINGLWGFGTALFLMLLRRTGL
jgi:hypothetical protein